MRTDQNKVSGNGKQAKSFNKVLAQSKHVKGLVDECGEKLASVNAVLTQKITAQDLQLIVKDALKESTIVESKVLEAANELRVVNRGLQHEARERLILESQLALAEQKEQYNHHASMHDILTKLPNRALFDDRLNLGVAHAKRHDSTLAILFLDLDNFKNVNDDYGHDAGDTVLQTMAQRLQKTMRSDDTISRHGGDEFLYLLMDFKNEQDITVIVEKILRTIRLPCTVGAHKLAIDASIGIAIFPKDGSSSDSLLKSADEAMYHAKRTKSGYAFAQ